MSAVATPLTSRSTSPEYQMSFPPSPALSPSPSPEPSDFEVLGIKEAREILHQLGLKQSSPEIIEEAVEVMQYALAKFATLDAKEKSDLEVLVKKTFNILINVNLRERLLPVLIESALVQVSMGISPAQIYQPEPEESLRFALDILSCTLKDPQASARYARGLDWIRQSVTLVKDPGIFEQEVADVFQVRLKEPGTVIDTLKEKQAKALIELCEALLKHYTPLLDEDTQEPVKQILKAFINKKFFTTPQPWSQKMQDTAVACLSSLESFLRASTVPDNVDGKLRKSLNSLATTFGRQYELSPTTLESALFKETATTALKKMCDFLATPYGVSLIIHRLYHGASPMEKLDPSLEGCEENAQLREQSAVLSAKMIDILQILTTVNTETWSETITSEVFKRGIATLKDSIAEKIYRKLFRKGIQECHLLLPTFLEMIVFDRKEAVLQPALNKALEATQEEKEQFIKETKALLAKLLYENSLEKAPKMLQFAGRLSPFKGICEQIVNDIYNLVEHEKLAKALYLSLANTAVAKLA